MNHFAFIFAAYCASAIGIIGLSAVIVWRGRFLTKKIALLEAMDKRSANAINRDSASKSEQL